MNIHEQLAALGVGISHHFGAGVYIKATDIPEGCTLTQHKHKFDHLSVLVSGTVKVTVDGIENTHTGPEILTIKAGAHHSVESITSAVWLCVHGTDETDAEHIDMELIE